MFSAKINFLTKILITIPSSGTNISPYLTLDYAYQGQPFVNVAASGNSVLVNKSQQCSLDYVYQAEPFYSNDLTFLNS